MNREEITKLLKRREGGNNYTESLLREYGYAKRHSRTKELIIGQTADIRVKSQLPRVAHNRHANQQIKSGGYYINSDTKEITGNAIHKPTSQWESVWFSGSNIKLGVGGSRRK